MGKLKDLWDELKNMDYDDPRKEEVQQEINKVEEWMISKGIKKDGVTQWNNNGMGYSSFYPVHTGFVRIEDVDLLSDFNDSGINYNLDNKPHFCSDECDNP